MKLLRCTLLLSASAGALMAQAATTRPTTAQPGITLVAGTDLVVDVLALRPQNRPLFDGAFINPTNLYMTARVTNRGRERWTSRGELLLTLRQGNGWSGGAGGGGLEIVRAEDSRQRDTLRFGPYRARLPLGPSIGPGQSQSVEYLIPSSAYPSTMSVVWDGDYLLFASIRATGDGNDTNNESDEVFHFRLAHRGSDHHGILEVVSVAPLRILDVTGTVRVSPPPRP